MNYTYTTHYQICDNVLNNIREDEDMHAVNIEPFLGESRRAKLAIVRTLAADGYIHRVKAQTKPLIISITVKGWQFWSDGGYKAHFQELREKQVLEQRLLSTNIESNVSIRKHNRWQLGLTILTLVFIGVSSFYQYQTYQLDQIKLVNDEKQKKGQDLELIKLNEKIHALELKFSPGPIDHP
jgi:hypothetical protein